VIRKLKQHVYLLSTSTLFYTPSFRPKISVATRRYHYQPPAGKPNHTCGGADRWADVVSTDDVFCPPGYYCPSTVQKLDCSSG